jgi:hypothetical protein
MGENKIFNIQSILITFFAVIGTWELHEFSHWLAGTVLGNQMAMTLNSTFAVNGKYLQGWYVLVVDAAGPLITVMEALICFLVLRKSKSLSMFPFLLTCLYMRALAGAMNIIQPNDEGRLSLWLGTDVFFVSLLVVGFLFYLVYQIVKKRDIPLKYVAIKLIWIIVFSSIIILTDQFLKVQIL